MFRFHPIIQTSYIEVHDWLSKIEDLPEYKTRNARNKVRKKLTDQTILSAALQYYVYFPGHAAKIGFTLANVIGEEPIVEWLKHNGQTTVIDVGCGAGAASVAFINYLLELRGKESINHPVHIHFVGIDPNPYAIAIYRQLLEQLRTKVQEYGLEITHTIIPEGHLRAVSDVKKELVEYRERWDVPFLTHTFLFQANVVSPFSEHHDTRSTEFEEKRQTLASLGVPIQELENSQSVFGEEEAIAYKRILENALIDNLHVITVGTKNYESEVKELAEAIDKEFESNSHVVKKWEGGKFSVTCMLPEACYWKEFRDTSEYPYPFFAEVSSISNVALADDDWQEIRSVDNLQTAWARARHHLLEQTLVDEIEIRLFESRLDTNIARLQQ